jgi:hypothetical protein
LFCGVALAAAASSPGQQGSSDAAGIGRMLRDASRAIQAGNAASFLGYFDKDEFAGFAALRENVVALTGQRQIASSIEITELAGAENGYRVGVSWLLQLSYTGDPGAVESRQEAVTCAVKEIGGKWKVVQLEPVSLFRP